MFFVMNSYAPAFSSSGTLVAIGNNSTNVAAYSNDNGATWGTSTLPTAGTWNDIAYGNGVFCAIRSGSAEAATSVDGTSWTSRTLPASTTWKAITWSGSVFCAVATNSSQAATSPDGITWTSRTLTRSAQWDKICWSGLNFVVSDTRYAQYSSDGASWSESEYSTGINYPVHGIVGGNPSGTRTVVAPTVNTTDSFKSTSNGATWTGGGSITSSDYIDGAWNGTIFCFVAGGTNTAITTTNGSSFSGQTMSDNAGWTGICWNGAVFCAVANGPSTTASTSPDGVTWTARTLPFNQSWSAIASAGEIVLS